MSLLSFMLKGAAATAGTLLITKLIKGIKTQNVADALKSEILNVYFKGIFGQGILENYAEFDIKFQHTNALPGELFIKNIFLDLFLGGYKVGSVRIPNANIRIEGEKITRHRTTVRTRILDLLGAIAQMIIKKDLPKTIFVKGYLVINDFRVEYNESFPLVDESQDPTT